jgi:hypothetical protein
VKNLRAAGEATQRRTGEPVRVVELPADEARPLLRQFPVLVPTGVSFMKRSGLVTDGTPENSKCSPVGAPCSGSIRVGTSRSDRGAPLYSQLGELLHDG